ncbi:prepilin peptidase [Streptomyces spectabilis]|uniref:Leader peptidase (Prepilin peptidase)/N-methyltransferase n=1 Tax=Streptomyces spectabilis TaxID=68270 RepID=A0A7W8B0Q1_STRST|nr:A24 family peptidase [Streptomyces spectabilis]MBB5108184.1 leader peptidase (prepilin peptidase)/N-methyltransferase [Streptomyces spectabilis]MCI3904406.1 A24 family peptidase [Streptomyces spectabilis]
MARRTHGGGVTVELVLALGGALWGALAGLALPRAVYRFSAPAGEPWHDRCPSGAHEVRGWLGRGHCPDGERYGPWGPALAAVAAAVCALLGLATGPRPELVVWLLCVPPALVLACVDRAVMRLPDVLTLPLAAAALALLGVAAALPEHGGDWAKAALGALVLSGGCFVLFLINPNGMAFGDVKLALALGAVLGWYGWGMLLLGTFAGFVCAALYGGWLVVVRGAGRRTAIAFGPFLLAGGLTGVLLGAYAT